MVHYRGAKKYRKKADARDFGAHIRKVSHIYYKKV